MVGLSSVAAVLALGLCLGGSSCFAERSGFPDIEVDLVSSGAPSSLVPFHSGMEVHFSHERVDAETSGTITMAFIIMEDMKEVANVAVEEDLKNELKNLSFTFTKNGIWGNRTFTKREDHFSLGIIRRIQLVYSGGLFQGAVWNKDGRRKMTWSSGDAPTMGQGNLTIFAWIPNWKSYYSFVFWPSTLPSAPPPASSAGTHCLVYIYVLAAFVVASLILLALLCWQLRRISGLLKAKGKSSGRDPLAQRNEGSEERCSRGAPGRYHAQEEWDVSERRDSINSIYGYIPRD